MTDRDDARHLFLAIAYGKVHRLSSILSSLSNVDCRDSAQRTPLIQAVFSNRDEIRAHCVRLLIRHGCDVNAKDGDGRTALMYACMEEEKAESVRLLVRCDQCDPNLVDNEGYSAIMHAVIAGNSTAIKIIAGHSNTRAKVDVNMRNRQNLTALDLAVKLRLADCCSALVNEGRADMMTVKNNASLIRLLSEGRIQTQIVNGALMTPREDTSNFNGVLLRSRFNTYVNSPRDSATPIRVSATPVYLQRKKSELYMPHTDNSPHTSPRDLPVQSPRTPRAPFDTNNFSTPIHRPLTPLSPSDTPRHGTIESPIQKIMDKICYNIKCTMTIIIHDCSNNKMIE
ncbi:hypothetical protein LOTGIDRAFT_238195 [Lottia gigantea]|uniref:Uncharacterized protein n=1 Tax=Lottia gigantea TaxID=225164 RepID=V4CHV2_LOTGI|nr:hypothetical protein LOTGIDRAFT_238195 [Lottia gigantea]ESP01725.1 hypothetical protein LOTGIDRAFT_238195 [Lottia gigantea]